MAIFINDISYSNLLRIIKCMTVKFLYLNLRQVISCVIFIIYVWIHLSINININYITENHYNISVIPIKSMIISCPEKIVIYYSTIVSYIKYIISL